MAITPAALASEINTDPLTYGYAARVAAGDDGGIVALLNKPRDGTDGEAAISVKRADCDPSELLAAIDVRDLATAGLPAGMSVPLAQSWLESVTQFPRIRLANDDGSKTLIRRNIDRLVADTNGSQTRLDAVAVRVGSRAEQLGGAGTVVTGSDVSFALRGTR
jgi:hypothetical protein